MNVDELRELLESTLGSETLLNEIEKFFNNYILQKCYESIARDWDIEIEEK